VRRTRRLALAAAAAAMSLAAVAPPAYAGPASPSPGLAAGTPTRITIHLSDSAIDLRDRVIVSGRLLRVTCSGCRPVPVAGAWVHLQWWQPSRPRWGPLASMVTDASGRYRFSRAPNASGAYRVVYSGRTTSPALAPSTSPSVRITVLP